MDATAASSPATASPDAAPQHRRSRLMSVDALRGFDMFWILGADALVRGLSAMNENAVTTFLRNQLVHADWVGFRFYDLIFPLFVFIVGVSAVFSLTRTIEEEGRAAAMKRIFTRSVLLFLLGIFYSGGLSNPWPDIRLMGVLNRIALCYFFAGLLFCYLKPRALVAIATGLLLGYWAILHFIPIRDIRLQKDYLVELARQQGTTNSLVFAKAQFEATTATTRGHYDPGYNVANHFDFQYLPGRKYDTYYDPEGYLSTIPAIVTCLLGMFAGLLLRSANFCDRWKLIYLLSMGVGGVLLGWLWHLEFPVVKKIWTSSYVLVAGGYSALLLAAFYFIVDVRKWQTWCQPFVWIGMNSITIYIAANLLGGFRNVARRLAGGDVKLFLDNHVAKGAGDMMLAIVGLLLAFWFVHFLYRKKIFLRL